MADKISMESLFGSDAGDENQGKVGLQGILKKGQKAKSDQFGNLVFPRYDSSADDSSYQDALAKIAELEKQVKQLQNELKSQETKHQTDLEQARNEAVESGRQEGSQQATEQAQAQFQNELDGLQLKISQVFQALGQEKDQFFNDLQLGAIDIAKALFERMVGKVAESDTQLIENAVREAMSVLGNESQLVLRVNAADKEFVEKHAPIWVPMDASIKSLEVVADDRVETGGCLLETEAGSVDARRQVMMEQLERIFTA